MNDNMNDNLSYVEIKPKIDKLWNFLDSTFEKLDKLSVQNTELISRNSTLESSLGDKDSSFYEMVNQKSELELRLHNLSLKNQELEKKLEESKLSIDQLDTKQEEIIVLQNMYADLEQKYNLVAEKANFVPILDDELSKEREKYNALLSKSNSLEIEFERLKPLETEKSIIENELKSFNEEFNILLNEKKELESTIDRLLPFENGYAQLKIDLNESHQKYAELHKEKSDLKMEIARLIPLDKNFSIVSKELSHKNIVLNERAMEIDKLKSVIAEHENTIYKLRNSESNLHKVIEQKDSKINELNAVVSKFESEIDSIKNGVENDQHLINKELTDSLEFMNSEKESAVLKISDLSNQLNDVIFQIDSSNNFITDLKSALETSNNSLNNLNDKIATYEAKIDDYENQIAALKRHLQNTDDLSSVDNSFMIKDIEIRALTSKIDELEYQLSKINSNDVAHTVDDPTLEVLNYELKVENSNLRSNFEDLEMKYLQIVEENKDLILNLNEMSSLYEELDKSFKLTKSSFQELSVEFNDLKNSKSQSFEILDNFKKQYESETSDLLTLIAEKDLKLIDINNNIESQLVEKSRFENIALNLQSDFEKVNTEINDYKMKLGDLNNELSNSESARNASIRKIDELKQIITNLSEQIIAKDKEIIQLNSNDNQLFPLTDSGINHNELEDSINDRSSLVNKLEEEVGRLTNQIVISNVNLEQSREKIEDLEELLKTRYEQINILETQLNEIIHKPKGEVMPNIDLVNRIDKFIDLIDAKIAAVV